MSENWHGLMWLGCFIVLMIAAFACSQQRDTLKVEAVKRGFAQWVVNDEGTTTFQWKEGAE